MEYNGVVSREKREFYQTNNKISIPFLHMKQYKKYKSILQQLQAH